MAYETMHGYYTAQEALSTYKNFQSRADLDAHERVRRELFTEKLFLPARLFRGARMIEFGPDAGENSLVFARWGASCTLLEPNVKAHQPIRDYFHRFDLTDRLASLDDTDLAGYAEHPTPEQKFDFIDAEGFIYTVKPDSLWIDLFRRIVNDDAFVILYFCEAFGNLLELFTKMIHSRARQLTGESAVDIARDLFLAKWNSIPHFRSLETFVMDVIENPFVRLRYFLESQSLCAQMQDADFSLYSSWPPYKDGLSFYWFKKSLSAEEQLRSQDAFIARSRLSHMFGRSHFLRDPVPALEKDLWSLLTLTDGLIDRFDGADVKQCANHLSTIAQVIESDAVIAKQGDRDETLRCVSSLQQILQLLSEEAVPELIRFCNSDPGFINTWGSPSHFVVFRKKPARS